MRALALLIVCRVLSAQTTDPAGEPLTRAYEALRVRDYRAAVEGFAAAIAAAPERVSIRKDLGYVYLRIGENKLAREQFRKAMELDSSDTAVAMEFAFLCFEANEQAQARRIFDRIRKTGNETAERAYHNIDDPLAAGIERWKRAIVMGADNFGAHFDLATLAERRDELELAATHYERAWRLKPEQRYVLVHLGRVWRELGRAGPANAALLAASRGGEPRAAEAARELLPARYPYVTEFQKALEFDRENTELRREFGYLLLRMERPADAEQQFRVITEQTPGDLLSATQLAFLLFARGEKSEAMPLFERVLAGDDEDLANRVRAVLRMPQVLRKRSEVQPTSIDAKVMAERSMKAGYMKDALKYLELAHEADPGDFEVMVKLGWTYNILKDDRMAIRWFDLARKSADPQIASEAAGAWQNLRRAQQRFLTTGWMYPMFSSRWRDLFSYGQVRTELRTRLPLRPYVSARFVGDTRGTIGVTNPQYLSESSVILGFGVTTRPWHGVTGWMEAGSAVSYLRRQMLPDYRGGVSFFRAAGNGLRGESAGWFAEATADGVFVSRFGDDFLVYGQTRVGYSSGPGWLRTQAYWNTNVIFDVRRQSWANVFESGPGVRFAARPLPESMHATFDVLRGSYLISSGGRKPGFNDLRAGVWYAFSY